MERHSSLFLIVLLLVETSCDEPEHKCDCDSPNVRTVLFRKADLYKACWSREEIALLFTRRMMQELIPKAVPKSIPLMLNYIKSCLETVKQMTSSRRTHALVLAALADTLGGYLQAFGLPAANGAYYAGWVNYCVVRQLHELEAAFKRTLRTDGGGWTRPNLSNSSVQEALPLRMANATNAKACSNLILNFNQPEGCRDENGEGGRSNWRGAPKIDLPFLDDAQNPNAIAVPFKNRSLYSLSSKSSSDILVRYYQTSIVCIREFAQIDTSQSQCEAQRDNPVLAGFNTRFYNWLSKLIIPRLQDERWYAGFGSVLRIIATIRNKGQPMTSSEEENDKIREEEELKEEKTCEGKQSSTLFYALVVVLILIVFWVFACLFCLVYRFCAGRSSKTGDNSQSSMASSTANVPVVSTLVSLYCGPKDSTEGQDSSRLSAAESSSSINNQQRPSLGRKKVASDTALRKTSTGYS